MKLTPEQKREIYCVKHGHAKFVTTCFGYVYCGRCGNQIGDRLGGYFDLGGYLIVGHKVNGKDCDKRKEVRKKLSKSDLKILEALERKEK